MKKLLLISVLVVVLSVPATSMARTNVFFNFGIGVPAPVFIAPSPFVVAPAPVFVVPVHPFIVRPVRVIEPAPVIIVPRGYVIHDQRHFREFEEDEDD